MGQTVENPWKTVCNEKRCSLRAKTPKTGSIPIELHIYKVNKQSVIEVTTPLGISLQRGVILAVDEKALYKTKLLSCEPDGCHAFAVLEKTLLNALKRGLKLSVVLVTSRSRETIVVDFSLLGFTEQFGLFAKK